MKTILKFTKMVVLTSFIFCGVNNSNAQAPDAPVDHEPGKCYAKCLIPDQYEEVEETFAVFSGGDQKDVQLDSVYFKIQKHTGALIYLGSIDDLNEKQLEEIDQLEKIVFVKNEKETQSYIEQTIKFKRLYKTGGFVEWKEVLCGDRINSNILINLQEALIEKGYSEYLEPIRNLNIQIKTALSKYQRDFGLPVGNLDFETLEALHIRY